MFSMEIKFREWRVKKNNWSLLDIFIRRMFEVECGCIIKGRYKKSDNRRRIVRLEW